MSDKDVLTEMIAKMKLRADEERARLAAAEAERIREGLERVRAYNEMMLPIWTAAGVAAERHRAEKEYRNRIAHALPATRHLRLDEERQVRALQKEEVRVYWARIRITAALATAAQNVQSVNAALAPDPQSD